MSGTEFRLEVGKAYIDGFGERHVCTKYLEDKDAYDCVGDETGSGWYYPTGQIRVGSAEESQKLNPEMTLRPIK